MMGEEGNWQKQHMANRHSWLAETLSSPSDESWPKLAAWLSDAIEYVEFGFTLFGVPVILLWLSGFWPCYREQKTNETP